MSSYVAYCSSGGRLVDIVLSPSLDDALDFMTTELEYWVGQLGKYCDRVYTAVEVEL